MKIDNKISKNFYFTLKLHKSIYNKVIKPKTYNFYKKTWLNNKHTKTKIKSKIIHKIFRSISSFSSSKKISLQI